LIAKIKAGFIEAQNIVVNNTLVAKNIAVDNIQIAGKNINQLIDERINLIINSNHVVSPIVETETIITNEIKAVNQDLIINLDNQLNQSESVESVPNSTDSTNKGALAHLIIKGLEGKTVTTIDAAGNASFSGQIIADSLKIDNDATISGNLASNTLTTNDASISGKLIAGEIESSTINDIQSLLADIKNQPISDLNNQTNLSNASNLSSQQLNNETMEQLTVTGNSNLYNVSVSNSLLVGTTLIDQNSIISLASELKLSALSTINLFDGAVIIAKDGKITTRGEIIAEGGIRTNEIKSLTDDGQVSIKNLTINNLTIDKISTNSAIIAAPDNFAQNGIFAPAIEAATASAGLGILPANQSEVIIYNDRVSADSLIYLTPTSDAPTNSSLTVGEKSTGAKPYFKVIGTPSAALSKFNWLIIN